MMMMMVAGQGALRRRWMLFLTEQESWRLPFWPCFTTLWPFLSEAAVDSGKLRAPVGRYEPLTRVEGDMEHDFPSVPPLEPGLSSVLLPDNIFGRRKSLFVTMSLPV